MEREELKPIELQLGNFIDNFGNIEMVTGLIPQGDKSWFICHKSWHQENNPLGDGIQYPSYGVPLTEEWKLCLGIDKYKFPEWVQYVHQAQNYMKWYANVNLLETMDWDMFKKFQLQTVESIQ